MLQNRRETTPGVSVAITSKFVPDHAREVGQSPHPACELPYGIWIQTIFIIGHENRRVRGQTHLPKIGLRRPRVFGVCNPRLNMEKRCYEVFTDRLGGGDRRGRRAQ